jgi:transcriptional regulator with XRE-family HTH domain
MAVRTAVKKAFGARLRAIRLDRKLTYAAIAKLLEVSVPMILKYERGISFPTVEALIDMAQRLEVSLDGLLGLDPRPPSRGSPRGPHHKIGLASASRSVPSCNPEL